MVNTKHDVASYENCNYQREIFDMNVLYDAYIKSKKGSDWKASVQRFEMNFLNELSKIHRELKNEDFRFKPHSKFVLKERGKTRVITGEQMHDRVAKSALAEEAMLPAIRKYLAYDNGASLKGKGITFSRNRLETHLRKYYSTHGTNEGYVLLMDFSKYFDNLQHDYFKSIFDGLISDNAMWFLDELLKRSEVDVSYMSDEEYKSCMHEVFNSLAYQNVSGDLLTGERFMQKHMNIGDTIAQIAGVSYPTRFDNYVKIVKGIKFFGRYMDDSYVIHGSKEYLIELLDELVGVATSIGLTINLKKTQIVKLSSLWRYLQIQYSLTDTGRVVKKIHPKRLTGMRRKLKKLVHAMGTVEFENYYRSWFKNHYKHMSKAQRENMDDLFNYLRKGDQGENCFS